MRALLVAASVVAVAVLVVVGTSKGDPGPTLAAGTPKPLNQIPLAQAFHLFLPKVSEVHSLKTTLPANLGLAITDVRAESGGAIFIVKVNGLIVKQAYGAYSNSYMSPIPPGTPVVVPPGAALELAIVGSSPKDMNISGFILTLADLGLQ